MARKLSPQDEHWANWQKRHRSPRAIDVLMGTRAKEAANRKAEEQAQAEAEALRKAEIEAALKDEDETSSDFDVDEDVEKSF